MNGADLIARILKKEGVEPPPAFALLRNGRPGPVTLEALHRPLPHRRRHRGDGGPPARARPGPTLRRAAPVERLDRVWMRVRARRAVPLCAGASASPQLPTLSGIGGGAALSRPGFDLDMEPVGVESGGWLEPRSPAADRPPRFRCNVLQDRRDLAAFRKGARPMRGIAAQPAFDGLRGRERAPAIVIGAKTGDPVRAEAS